MAEGVPTELLFSKVILGHLECSICCTYYNQPKYLDCSHSYCLRCLQELKTNQNPDTNKLKCPLCQKETILPNDGVTGLRNNYLLVALVEEVNKQEQLPQGGESKVMCQACDEENAAISRCLNCEHYLCLECQKAHQRFSALKNHEIKTLAELQEVDETQTESKMNISRCDIHPIQELCLYCMTCEQLICQVCTLQHQAPLHTFLDLESATDNYLSDIIDGVSQLDRSNSNLTSRLELLLPRLSIMINKTKKQISEKAEKGIAEIRNKERMLLQEASEVGSRKGKTVAKLIFAKEALNIVQSSNTDSKTLEILKNRQKHLHEYINIDEGKTEDLTYDLSFLGLKESEDGIGTLLLKETWGGEVTARVGGDLIGAFSTGDLLVVGKNKDTIFTIINPKGAVSRTYGQSWFHGNLEYPTSLAVNKDDHIIILDGPTVKTFGSNYQLLHQFTPGEESDSEPTCLAVDENNLIAVGYKDKEEVSLHSPDESLISNELISNEESDSEPTCLAVDENNLIPVGYKDKGEVSLHNPDGSLIRTLSAPGIDKYMIMSNNRIIYTSPNENAIMCLNINDTKCEVFLRYPNATPYGICCNTVGDDDFYVVYKREPKPDTIVPQKRGYSVGAPKAVTRLSKQHCICRYRFGTDPSIIVRSKDIFHDITYTPRGQLAVVGEECTMLYQRV